MIGLLAVLVLVVVSSSGAKSQPQTSSAPTGETATCLITIDVEGRVVQLCQAGKFWRVLNGDTLERRLHRDAAAAAQRAIAILKPADANAVAITTPRGRAEVQRTQGGWAWRVDLHAEPGELDRFGVEPTLLDAVGSAYAAAGGI